MAVIKKFFTFLFDHILIWRDGGLSRAARGRRGGESGSGTAWGRETHRRGGGAKERGRGPGGE